MTQLKSPVLNCGPQGKHKVRFLPAVRYSFINESICNLKKKKKKCSCLTAHHSLFVLQFSSVTQSCLNLCDCMNHSTLGLPVHYQLPEFTQITSTESVMLSTSNHLIQSSNHLILCHPLLHLPSIPPSIRVFSNQSALCMRLPKYYISSVPPMNTQD